MLSGAGDVVYTTGGATATITAFGVQTGLAGLTFGEGLLFGVGFKSVVNVATSSD